MKKHPTFNPDDVLIRDVYTLRRAVNRGNSLLPHQDERLQSSMESVVRRSKVVPAISFPPELPITNHIDEIVNLLGSHQVVVVAGETGSGKTTQLPKACLKAGFGIRGMIGHTQPRRLAARTVAERVASELGVSLGQAVGFAMRFSESMSKDTLVKVMTDGLLLTEIRRDRYLNAYEVLILDEAHERSLNIDFLIGYAKDLLRRRKDLKLIITSATIDVDSFSAHFGEAPVVSVSGRGFPVNVVYSESDEIEGEAELARCLDEIAELPSLGACDVLVFLPGEREILETSLWLKREYTDRFEVLPLYARLPVHEQRRIFSPGKRQRVVLATNVAETSVTVPNIGYVIDTGTARISRYSFRSKIQRLPIEPISQASADQRKGRCGRIAPGTCYRLYLETDFDNRSKYTDPELKRTNLASVVLQMRAFRLGDIERFPFIDPPDPRAVRDAVRSLHELGAFDGNLITEMGRTMARLPVDPRLARMLIAASKLSCLEEMLIIVSALSIQDPRDRPLDKQQAADEAHSEYRDGRSDFLSFVRLWNALESDRQDMTRSAFRRHLERRFLSPTRVREWRALHRQLLLAVKSLGMRVQTKTDRETDYAAVHRALLTGSLSFIGIKGERGLYQGARNLKFRVFPGSTMAKKAPKWLVAAEIAETQRTYARCVAAVESRWIEAAASHLLKRSHSEPHWDEKRGEVVALERATVYGLPVVERRSVSYSDIDPILAREIFVRDALVSPSKFIRAPFLARNLKLLRKLTELQAKGRRSDLLVSDKAQETFYLERLPENIFSVSTLNTWARKTPPNVVSRMEMTETDLLSNTDIDISDNDFPPFLSFEKLELRVKYKFAPGEQDDGVSLQVPLGVLPHLRSDPLEWLVPGFFEQKCIELMRGLPKGIRRQLAPIPDKSRAIVSWLLRSEQYRQGKLRVALAERIRAEYGVEISIADWSDQRVSPFMRLNVQIIDAHNGTIDQDRNLVALKKRILHRSERQSDDNFRARYEQHGLESYPEDGVSETLLISGREGESIAYPALRDSGSCVDLVLLSHHSSQHETNRLGYSRLALISDRKTMRYLIKQLDGEETMFLQYASLGTRVQLVDELVLAASWLAFFEGRSLPRVKSEFEYLIAARRAHLTKKFFALIEVSREILAKRFEVGQKIAELESPAFKVSRQDLELHLERLVPKNFLNHIASDRINDIPRYLRALGYRADNLRGHVKRDVESLKLAVSWEKRILAVNEEIPNDPEANRARYLIEEFRVALFGQQIGTKEKVSPERLARVIEPLEMKAGLR